MNKLIIEGSFKSPKIKLDADNGLLEFIGNSIPENSTKFYEPIMNWLDRYVQSPCSETVVNFKLMYFNSASKRSILNILKKLESSYKNGNKIAVNWYYEEEDTDMLDAIETYQKLVSSLPINVIVVEEEDE